jgi:hypothetical protein
VRIVEAFTSVDNPRSDREEYLFQVGEAYPIRGRNLTLSLGRLDALPSKKASIHRPTARPE